MPSRIETGAVERIQAKLRALPDQLQGPIKAQIDAGGQRVLAQALRRVPVDHGDLKRGISLVKTGPFGWAISVNATARRGRHRFNYAWFVEFGTRRSISVTISAGGKSRKVRRRQKVNLGKNARPFLFPAYRAFKRTAGKAIGQEIRRVLGIVAVRQ